MCASTLGGESEAPLCHRAAASIRATATVIAPLGVGNIGHDPVIDSPAGVYRVQYPATGSVLLQVSGDSLTTTQIALSAGDAFAESGVTLLESRGYTSLIRLDAFRAHREQSGRTVTLTLIYSEN